MLLSEPTTLCADRCIRQRAAVGRMSDGDVRFSLILGVARHSKYERPAIVSLGALPARVREAELLNRDGGI